MKRKICCIFNFAPHYRSLIYHLMDKELQCDFYIGDNVETPVKRMDYFSLKGFQKELRNTWLFSHFYWQKKSVQLVFRPYKYYIITGELYCISSWLILIFSLLLCKETYVWTHGWYGNEKWLKRKIKKIFFKLPSGVLLYGEYAKKLMIREGLDSHKLHYIGNSLDYDIQLKMRKESIGTNIYKLHFKNDFPVIIYVGRIQKIKRLDLLTEAISVLCKKGVNVNLVIVGEFIDCDQSDFSGLKDIAEKVWFYGPCYDEKKISELFYNASICVSPGNIGLTAIHALTYGCPVITHNNFTHQMPEFESIELGRTGAFFTENSVESLVENLTLWFKETDREYVRSECYKVIDEKYNPYYQLNLLRRLLNR